MYNNEIFDYSKANKITDLFNNINELYILLNDKLKKDFNNVYNYTNMDRICILPIENISNMIHIFSVDDNNPVITLLMPENSEVLKLTIGKDVYNLYTNILEEYIYLYDKIVPTIITDLEYMKKIYYDLVSKNYNKNSYELNKDNENMKEYMKNHIYMDILTLISNIDNKKIKLYNINLDYDLYLNIEDKELSINNINNNIVKIETINESMNINIVFDDGNILDLYIRDLSFKKALDELIDISDKKDIMYIYKKLDSIATAIKTETTTDNISDGFHTFEELYEHRAELFSVICNTYKDNAWKSKLHHDGTMHKGYFVVGITTPEGIHIHYYTLDKWDLFDVKELDRALEYRDEDKPSDFTRLFSLIK